jgi:type III restriction enzyme
VADQNDNWRLVTELLGLGHAWRKCEHQKRCEFSPDFFLKKGNTIYVVEIKDDGEIEDPAPENQKKFEFAQKHFRTK